MDPSLPHSHWDESPAASSKLPSGHHLKADQPKKPRHRHAPHQLAALNELYDKTEHPSLEERTALAELLGMYVTPSLCLVCYLLNFPPIMQGDKDGQLLVSE